MTFREESKFCLLFFLCNMLNLVYPFRSGFVQGTTEKHQIYQYETFIHQNQSFKNINFG